MTVHLIAGEQPSAWPWLDAGLVGYSEGWTEDKQATPSPISAVSSKNSTVIVDNSTITTGARSRSIVFASSKKGNADSITTLADDTAGQDSSSPKKTKSFASFITGTEDNIARSVDTFKDGTSIVAGFSAGDVTIGSTTLKNAGSYDGFITKYNQDGTVAWVTQAGGAGLDAIYDASTLEDGSAIVAGSFEKSIKLGSITLASDTRDTLIAKVNKDGTYAWASQGLFKGNPLNGSEAISVSSLEDGSAIAAGYYADVDGTASLTFGDTTLASTYKNAYISSFITKTNTDGSFAWATGAYGDYVYTECVDAFEDGSSVITGFVDGYAEFGNSSFTSDASDGFIAKVNKDGGFAWVTHFGGLGNDDSYSVAALKDGSSLITGFFEGTAHFGDTTLSTNGGQDLFVAKLNSKGGFEWVTQGHSNNGYYSSYSTGVDISALEDGSCLITGYVYGSVSFGFTTLTTPVFDSGQFARTDDVLITKVRADGTFAWASQAGGPGDIESGLGISALEDGSSVVAGYYGNLGPSIFGDQTVTSAGGVDSFVYKVDKYGNNTAVPIVTSAAVDGNKVILSFSEEIKGKSLAASNFTRAIGSGPAELATAIAIKADNTISLTFKGKAPINTSSVKISYTPTTGTARSGLITDLTGNPLTSFANKVVDTFKSATSVVTLGDNGISPPATSYTNLALTGALSINGNGNAFDNKITGNAGVNSLYGGDGNDVLVGGAGDDILNGGAGIDTLTGDLGADIFRFDSVLNGITNADRLTDFTPTASATTTDSFQLENTGPGLFTELTPGTLTASAFISGAAFTNAAERIRYESTTGGLFYDPDGNGAQDSILFANLSTRLAINNMHFQVT